MVAPEPIFKPVFGESWNHLPPVIRKHYANRPYSDDNATVDGVLDVMCKWYIRPFFQMLGTIPPYSEQRVPVTVHFVSQPDSNLFYFNRIFHFRNRKPFHFRSRMFQVKGSEVVEQMRYGICWHCDYLWNGERVLLQHKGYSLRIGKIRIPMPINWLVGRSNAEEIPVDDNSFDMRVAITHPLLGEIYEYKGRFRVVKEV